MCLREAAFRSEPHNGRRSERQRGKSLRSPARKSAVGTT
jgi:hypothetical protein